jgi:hypothetical protein
MTGPRWRLVRVALAASLLLVASATSAQFPMGRGGQRWGRGQRVAPRLATPADFDGRFNFCRVMYDSVRREPAGQGWSTDYPNADRNMSFRLAELTKTLVAVDDQGEPKHVVVSLTDPLLFQCPFAVIEDAGTAWFSDEEAARLREYLLKGGFLWVDDFWGSRAWDAWVGEIAKALPPHEYPIFDVPPEHPIRHALYDVDRIPQIPSIQFWRQSGGMTSERGLDSAEPHMRAIKDAQDRIVVLMTHNTDISDAWEREGEDVDFFYAFSVEGYSVGINVLLYAMSH